ncbi:MAG: hypothetical protein IKL53_06690 [Lachnospiraceae bacterium]|nr:hypothetical protein [Lachnospiraceae bacterium]
MSEDVSATMRVGITVILVAALVATVLNLMVMSNSLLSGGQTTLQSGIDSVSQQEFATYNNTKVSGTQVNTAISLFQGRDIAILVQTKTFKTNYNPTSAQGQGLFMNYGAILSSDYTTSKQPNGFSSKVGSSDGKMEITNIGTNPLINASGATEDAKLAGCRTLAGSTVGSYYVVNVTDSATNAACYQPAGQPSYVSLLYDLNGIVQTNSNIIGCSTLGNPQYILTSARFQSVLIKDATGSIIGIVFYQI